MANIAHGLLSGVLRNLDEEQLGTFFRVIDKLVGNGSNLKIRFQDLRFNLGETRIEPNGEINFDIVREKKSPVSNINLCLISI